MYNKPRQRELVGLLPKHKLTVHNRISLMCIDTLDSLQTQYKVDLCRLYAEIEQIATESGRAVDCKSWRKAGMSHVPVSPTVPWGHPLCDARPRSRAESGAIPAHSTELVTQRKG